MRNIGDIVWLALPKYEDVYTRCPDCLGTARWHCVLPSGEEFDVECPRCYPGGYMASTGQVKEELTFQCEAVEAVIAGVQMRDGAVEYTTSNGHFFSDPHDVCDTKEEALARCIVKGKEHVASEMERFHKHAKSKGRPRKDEFGNRVASDNFGGQSIVYAKRQIRQAFKDALKWAQYALSKGVTVDMDKLFNEVKGRKQ